jgi:hypothetical protein
MSNIEGTLSVLVDALSEENYDETVVRYRLWLNIGSRHTHVDVQDRVDYAIRHLGRPSSLQHHLIHPTAHLLIRFIGDLEADHTISRHVSGLHVQHCTSKLSSFFSRNIGLIVSRNLMGLFSHRREPHRTMGQPRIRGRRNHSRSHPPVSHLSPNPVRSPGGRTLHLLQIGRSHIWSIHRSIGD